MQFINKKQNLAWQMPRIGRSLSALSRARLIINKEDLVCDVTFGS